MSSSAATIPFPIHDQPPAAQVETIDGRSRLVLEPPAGVLRVCSGRVNLFLEPVDEPGAPSGARGWLLTLTKGEAIALPREVPAGYSVIAVGIGSAAVELSDRDNREIAQPESLVGPLERMLEKLGPREEGEGSLAIEPGTSVTAQAGGGVTAKSLTWVEVATADESGDDESWLQAVAGGQSLPVEAGTTVNGYSTSDALMAGGRGVLEQNMAQLFRKAGETLTAERRMDEERTSLRREREARTVGNALAELPALMDGQQVEAPHQLAEAASPAVQALALLCGAEDIAFEMEAVPPDTGEATEDLLQAMRLAGLRWRRISLRDGWWRQDGSAFIAFDEAGAPQAVIRRGAARFEIADPQSGKRTPAESQTATRLQPFGYVVFRPLPWRRLRASDLVRHVLATPASIDLRWALAMALLAALVGLLTPVITGVIVNEAVPFAESRQLLHLSLALVMIAIGSALFEVVRAIALLRVEAFADGSLQAAVWDRLLRLPMTFFRRYQTGELLVKAMAPTRLRQTLSDTAVNSCLAAIFSLVNFAVMWFYDKWLAFAALGFTLVSMLLLGLLTWRQLRHERTLVKADAAVSSFNIQLLQGIQKVRLSGAENRAYSRWLRRFTDQRLRRYRASRVSDVTTTLNATLPVLASLLFFAVVGFGDNAIATGDFAAFTVAFGQFQAALLGLVGALSVSLAAVPIYENMKPILDAQPEVDEVRQDPGPLSGRIALHDVSFRYHPDGPVVLDRIDLGVEPGEFVALVGPSGSGKSTIFRMLLGFETPESGSLLYDGRDLAKLDLKAVRRQLGVVLQRGTLLPGSIYDNIVGSLPLPEAAAWEAARMAGFEDDIRAMPMGMHTELTDGGGTLSGGQRQRLMIARAIVRKPRILLMDEATSALDNRTQAIVSDSLAAMNATRIVIAHRLSTVRHADRIHVVDKGRIVQSGSYEELMERPGLFRDIAARQIL